MNLDGRVCLCDAACCDGEGEMGKRSLFRSFIPSTLGPSKPRQPYTCAIIITINIIIIIVFLFIKQ